MMRIASVVYNEAKDCQGRAVKDEKQISTYILAFEIAEKLLQRYSGQWKIAGNEIVLNLQGLDHPLKIDNINGTINYGTLTTYYYHRYDARKGVSGLVQELCLDLALPFADGNYSTDFLFKVFVKLVEIFHARCDLRILPGSQNGEWEIRLNQTGPSGWINDQNVIENRFGEKMEISAWEGLRPEKVATYIFGFNRFCKNFQCPMK
ncbi:MAG TPA: hypothetical protein GXX46_04915 [Peptococcaceae bacterium]|nr:hypothetical protein [Peptococcaceae bacterium]